MFHPGLDKEKSSELSDEEILNKINEIHIRMGLAHQLGRTNVLDQLQLLLAHYESIRQEKFDAEMQAIIDADPKLGRKVIDIDWADPNDNKDEDTKKSRRN